MRIAFLSVLFRHPLGGSKVGGGEISNRKLLELLALEHDVFVISAIGNKMWGESIEGVVYYDISSSKKFARFPSVLRNKLSKLFYRWSAPKVMKDLSPDVILCATLEYGAAARYNHIKRVPTGAFIRAFENFSSYNDLSLKQKIKRVFRKLIYGDTQEVGINQLDFLLPNSDYMDRLCEKSFKVASRYTIYPPVSLPRYRDIIKLSTEDRRVRSILMVSGAKKKGRDIFVKLAAHFPEIEFLILGYVVSQKDSEIYPKNLRALPWVDKPEELIAKADLVLVPSIWEEPFGRISVEALQCGTPVLVSDIGGLPETVNYQDSLLVEPGNELAWRDKVASYLNDPEAFVDANLRAMENAVKYSAINQFKTLEAALLSEVARMGVMRAEK